MKIASLSTTFWLLVLAATSAFAAVLGIDFGEEYTKASLVAPGVPFEIVLTDDSKRKDTSGITFKKAGKEVERVYGNGAASSLWARFPESSAFYYKPLLGVSLDDNQVKSYQKLQPGPQLVASNNNRSTVAYKIHGETYPVEEVLGMSFSKIKDRAASLLAANSGSGYVKEVSVTVPSYYTTEQRRAIQDAVEISGLKLISLVNDGVAVAVNFASKRQFTDKKEYHVIYDVGAGSTVATLVSFREGEIDDGSRVARTGTVIEVEGMGYNTELGGHALTSIIRDLLVDKFLEQNPKVKKAELLKDARVMNKLWRESDKAKVVLSANTETSASVESLYKDIDFRTKVSRKEFESLSEHLKSHVTGPITEALSNPLNDEATGLNIEQVESVILTGGSVRVPFIKNELQQLVEDKVSLAKNVNADEAAVLGAALRGVGVSKMFKSKDIQVIDRAMWDYEMEVDGTKSTLFPRGTPLDTTQVLPLDVSDDFSLTLFENGKDVGRIDATNVAQAIKNVKSDAKKDCVDDIVVEGELTLTHSRTVELTSLYAKCMAKDKVTSSSSASSSQSSSSTTASSTTESETDSAGDESTATESDSTGSTSTTSASTSTSTPSEKPARPLRRTISTKVKYNGPRPMGTASKQGSISRLRSMDRGDADRQSKEEARNNLEGTIYRVKDMLTDLDDSESALEKLQDEFSDWLEYDGQTASLTELNNKRKALEEFRMSFEPHIEPETKTTESVESATETVKSAESTPTSAGEGLRNLYAQMSMLREELSRMGADPDEVHGVDLSKLDEIMKENLDSERAANEKIDAAQSQLDETTKLHKDAESDAEKKELAAKIETQQQHISELKKEHEKMQREQLKAMQDLLSSGQQQPPPEDDEIVHEDL